MVTVQCVYCEQWIDSSYRVCPCQLKSSTLKGVYDRWLRKPNGESPERVKLVDAVFHACEEHYSAGGDVVVETFHPDEVLQHFSSVAEAREYCGLKVEQTTNYREGTDEDDELRRLADFGDWEAEG